MTTVWNGPFGALLLTAGPRGLTHAEWGSSRHAGRLRGGGGEAFVAQALAELEEYAAGRRRAFSVPLDPAGTPFQLAVWAELRRIPWGRTVSYSELARRMGRPRAVRAVGAANGRNPLSILVPCHRVVGADGSLTGYAGGLDAKAALLAHEGAGDQRTRQTRRDETAPSTESRNR